MISDAVINKIIHMIVPIDVRVYHTDAFTLAKSKVQFPLIKASLDYSVFFFFFFFFLKKKTFHHSDHISFTR